MSNEEKILDILGQMQTDMADVKKRIDLIDERSQRTAILMEADLAPKIQLLYEGHGLIMESLDKLATKTRVEMLESELGLVKHTIKLMRQEIADLKKAQ